ncbi:MAG: BatA and WFA domain-containing protein [Phycisphaerae bacterium]|nr:BatA and WFA domain-containing protein [Phycisphaerae bacterium]
MTFHGISPMAALLLAAGALAVLTAAHLLHRRYRRVVVPALRFWSAALKKHRQDTLGGRLRHPLTWLLLCALAGLMILGMLQPTFSGDWGPRPWVVVVDRRASMRLPCDAASCRLVRARTLARDFLSRAAGPVGVTLIAVDHTASVLAGAEDPKAESLYHLARLTCTDQTDGPGMEQALTLADTLVRREPRTGVLVLTDHPPAGWDVPTSLRSHLTVLNVAEPVDNLAVLPPEIASLADGTYRFRVWLAHWGSEPCRATLTVLHNGQAGETLPVSLAAGQMRSYDFVFGADQIASLSVRADREEAYTLDNEAAPPVWRRRRVFLADDASPALKAVVSANPAYQRATAAAEADVCVSVARSEALETGAYGPVQVTAALCPNEDLRRAWMTDLFLGPNVSPVAGSGSGVVLLSTTDAQPLAVRSDTVPTAVTLSASLFDDGATFWKQPQCPVILDAVLNPAEDRLEDASPSYWSGVCYGDLTSPAADTQTAQTLPPVRTRLPLARGILWVALLVALCELVCYGRGRIV